MSPVDKDEVGGKWGGGRRSRKKKPRSHDLVYRSTRGGGGGYATDIIATILTAAFFVLGFVVITAYLGSAVGKGWLLAVLSFLLVICAPVAVALWAVRPMSGRRAYRWWIGVFAAPFVLAVLGLGFAVPKRTSYVLYRYGSWLPELFAGRDGNATVKMKKATNWLAAIFHALPDEDDDDKPVKVVKSRPKPRKDIKRKIPFSGTGKTRSKKVKFSEAEKKAVGIKVRFKRRGGAIVLKGKAGKKGKYVTMLLDTGASLTAISPETAVRLGIESSPGAPMVEIETASGPAKYPAAILDKLSLGRATVRNMTVLICGPCSHAGLSGLIGLNFLRHFVVTINERRSRLFFVPHQEPANRAADVEPFVVFNKVEGEQDKGKFKIQGILVNRAPITIRKLTIKAVLLDEDEKPVKRLTTTLKKVKPKKLTTFTIEGPEKGKPAGFRLAITYALW